MRRLQNINEIKIHKKIYKCQRRRQTRRRWNSGLKDFFVLFCGLKAFLVLCTLTEFTMNNVIVFGSDLLFRESIYIYI